MPNRTFYPSTDLVVESKLLRKGMVWRQPRSIKESLRLCVHLDASVALQKELDQVLQQSGFQRIDTLLYADASLDVLDKIVRQWASNRTLVWHVQRVQPDSVFEL